MSERDTTSSKQNNLAIKRLIPYVAVSEVFTETKGLNPKNNPRLACPFRQNISNNNLNRPTFTCGTQEILVDTQFSDHGFAT